MGFDTIYMKLFELIVIHDSVLVEAERETDYDCRR